MVVITMTNCPQKLRGDLSKWLCEINTGVYVGQISARVRDALWDKVCENINNGQATMVYNAVNEQHLEFCTHNSTWKVKDFDGIKLMQKPKIPIDNNVEEELTKGFSNASRRRISARSRKSVEEYVFLDIETTGLDSEKDEIIEIGVLSESLTEIKSQWKTFIKNVKNLPQGVTELTGITYEMLQSGMELREALEKLNEIIRGKTIICYNATFDIKFLEKAYELCKVEFCVNRVVDLLPLARKRVSEVVNFKLETLAEYFEMEYNERHRAMEDCKILYQVYLKLNEI